MFVLKILAGIAAIVALYWLIKFIQRTVAARYDGYLPFTKSTFAAFCAGALMIAFGYRWYVEAAHKHGDILNGIILAALGVALMGWIILRNIRNTSFPAGIGITVAQIPIFVIFAYFGIFIVVIVFALLVVFPAILRSANPMTVRIVD
ncbi:hypothetical protein WBP07_09010 [Novosphingobium sp. BL-8A]|uniref:hypothetical protein n=1 Tax=Novosphingobium sp. BL-8A TaxID=3127639 RepID=UPI003756A109